MSGMTLMSRGSAAMLLTKFLLTPVRRRAQELHVRGGVAAAILLFLLDLTRAWLGISLSVLDLTRAWLGIPEMAPQEPVHLSQQILDPATTPPFTFAFNDFLRREDRFGLDPSRPACKAFLQGHCPLGNACPDKHTASNSFNK